MFRCAVLLVSALLLTACGSGVRDPRSTTAAPLPPPTSNRQGVTQANFGYLWPLTVESGTLECRIGTQVVFVGPDGKPHALNKNAEEAGVPGIGPLRKEGSGGGKVSLGALLSTGMGLCGKA